MPSYIEEPEAAACKWVSIREDNGRYELPAVFSILIYTHPETGFPLAICDGSHHTLMRTGSSAAVSAKWLARPDSEVLAIVGAGSVGLGSLLTCAEVFPWREVRVWSRSQESLDRLLAQARPQLPGPRDRRARPTWSGWCAARTSSSRARTPARWLIDDAWVGPGTHLAALGADLAGEQELDPRILQRARVFVDDIRQCREDGEINVALREGADHARTTSPARSARSSAASSRAASATTRSRCSTPRASRCRTPRRCRWSTSGPSRPASASRRR